MGLLLNIIILAIGVGGAIVSALALSRPWRNICVVVFGILDLIGLYLTFATYEATPGVPHFKNLWSSFWSAISAIFGWLLSCVIAIQQTSLFWILLVCGVSLITGWWLNNFSRMETNQLPFFRRPNVKTWLSSLQAFDEFVDPDLHAQKLSANNVASSLREQITNLKTRPPRQTVHNN